ncbi:MAG: hypothetical protein ACXVEF_09335 [Polyangiales bacterium]
MNHLRLAAVVTLAALVLHASVANASDVRPVDGEARPTGWPYAFTADVRAAMLIRSNSEYFHQAETFGYPVSNPAGGIVLDLGAEILPRLTLFAAGGYYGHGATREGFGKLMLTSESLLLGLRYAIKRSDVVEKVMQLQLEGWAAGGAYFIRETYSDPLLSAQTYVRDGSSAGFAGGLDASMTILAIRFIAGYAYHYAPASVSNEIGGVARAGGHQLTLGLGIRW